MTEKKIPYVLCFTLLLVIQVFRAQVTITIPSGNLQSSVTPAEWRKPLGTYFGFERSAFIYTHSEIGQFGTINSISFYCDTLNNPGNAPINIYLKEITSAAFAAPSTVATEESGAQLVYSGTLAVSSLVKGQWITFTLSNPFLHATANSVEVIVETNAGGSGNEINLAKGFYHYLTSIYAFQYWSADNTAPASIGTLSYKRPNVQFDMTLVTACSGSPNGGTTVSSVDTTCADVTLSLSGSTSATGLTYQWEDSLSGGAWTAISGASGSGLVSSISADTWFRCQVTCSSQSSYSTIKQVVMRNYLQCYCNSGLGGGCSNSAIDSVAIETTSLANASGCSTYIQYPAAGNTCAQLASGQNYNLHTKFGGAVIASVWIDYDQNGMFDSLEWKQIITTALVDSDYVTVLSVPANAKTGLTLMRIRTRAAGNQNSYDDACTNFGSGETEDYFIGINYDVSVSAQTKSQEPVLYPNPANQLLYIKGAEGTIEIVSLEGNVVMSKTVNPVNGIMTIDVSDLSTGVYFLKTNLGSPSSVKKLVISR